MPGQRAMTRRPIKAATIKHRAKYQRYRVQSLSMTFVNYPESIISRPRRNASLGAQQFRVFDPHDEKGMSGAALLEHDQKRAVEVVGVRVIVTIVEASHIAPRLGLGTVPVQSEADEFERLVQVRPVT